MSKRERAIEWASVRARIHWTFIVDEWMQQQRGYYFIYQFCLWCCCVVIVGFILSRLHRPNSLAIDDRWSLRMECMHHKMLRNEMKKKHTKWELTCVLVIPFLLLVFCVIRFFLLLCVSVSGLLTKQIVFR